MSIEDLGGVSVNRAFFFKEEEESVVFGDEVEEELLVALFVISITILSPSEATVACSSNSLTVVADNTGSEASVVAEPDGIGSRTIGSPESIGSGGTRPVSTGSGDGVS